MTATYHVPALSYPVQADLTLPGSKSQANRAILCAALADGMTTINNATPCDDVTVMVENLQKMGFDLEWVDKENGELKVKGSHIFSLTPDPSPDGRGEKKSPFPLRGKGLGMRVLDCHNAGTTLRFLTALACIVPGSWTITGDEHMRRRPIADLVAALASLGAEIEDTNGCPPVRIKGGSLRGGRVKLRATVSSQYLTSLLLIAPRLKEGLQIELDGQLASSGYVSLTKSVMADFGVTVHAAGNAFRVPPSSYKARPSGYVIEGDWSAAGVWLVFSALTGSNVSFTNLDPHSEQSDRWLGKAILTLRKPGDVAFDATLIPDQVMNLAVLAAFRNGKTRITGARNLRYKETDRLKVLTSELGKAGVNIEETDDGVIVRGNRGDRPFGLVSTPSARRRGELMAERRDQGNRSTSDTSVTSVPSVTSCALDPHDDHRMVMCFTLLGLLRGGISIANSGCVAKSYPGFFEDLERVLRAPKPIAIIGMRGAGKSHFGRRIAQRLKLKHLDADREFEKKFGPIRSFVETRGWPAFRKHEEEIVSYLLQPGVVLSCGGGAIESPKTREALKSRSIGIWVEARENELVKRLKSGKRPPLTKLPLHEEVRMLLKKRAPLYQEVTQIRIPAHLPFSRQIPYAVKKLESLIRRQLC